MVSAARSYCLLIGWLHFLLWLGPVVAVSVPPPPALCLDPPCPATMHKHVCSSVFCVGPNADMLPTTNHGHMPLPFSSEAYNIMWKNKRVQVRKMAFSVKVGDLSL